ncbi:MAG: hypothetical protein CMM23_16635 [Rhodospirillaceae bacterium]|jgi:uncharacterized protein (DUF983 family)|nr:hypothetical protein [Rhodospirillaceae bacterium]|tara:strand:+ start:337 stop:738 length:402 start_codon:yes stop_codon:yes gene_type:complete
MQDDKSDRSDLRPKRFLVLTSVLRGLGNRCPNCGHGALLAGYLTPHETCSSCGAPNGEIRAHDAPPYLTILIVGHIVVSLLVIVEQMVSPPTWVQLSIWLPVTLLLTLGLLPRIKGAWMGFMWALRLKGTESQ